VPEARNLLPVLFALVAFQPYAMATDAPSAPTPVAATEDEEEQVDEGLKRFGYLAGLVRGCVVENQRAASSFGYGTTVVVETKDCADVLKAYEARVEKFRASRGGTQ